MIARVKNEAKALLAPQIADIFLRCEPFFQPIFDLESTAVVFGRVALAGDAAFVARPHVGAGATKAAIDAAILAGCLRESGGDLKRGLARFESVQLPFGPTLLRWRANRAHLSAQLKPKNERSADERTRDIDALLQAHGTRSDQVGEIVVARGLDAHF